MANDNDETGSFYIFLRILQIITLIVTFSLLANVVAAYNHAGLPVPGAILCLFIVAILLTVWSFCILITYLRAHNVDYTIVFLDVVGMIALIVGVALLSKAANDECINISTAARYAGTDNASLLAYLQSNNVGVTPADGNYGSYCNLLRAAWALGIANIFFFFLTSLAGYQIARAYDQKRRRVARGGVRSRTIVEEEIVTGGPEMVYAQQAPATFVVAGEAPRRKKSSSKKKESKHKHKSSRDRDRDRERRRSRNDY